MPSPGDLYTAAASEIDYGLVRDFVLNAEAANLFTESLTLEAKEKRDKGSVAEAVAALGNSDGGIVLVGVKDKDATGEDRIVGVPKSEHDAVASNLHALIPEAMPEIIPVAMPDGQRLVLVLRVDADAVPHPVMVSGKVLFRIPGHSVPADRRRVLDLAARDQSVPGAEQARMNVERRPWQPADIALWPEDTDGREAQLRSGVLRVAGGLELPRRVLDRPWLGLTARQAALNALNNSPLRLSPNWHLTTWDTVEARATDLRLLAREVNQGTYRVQGGAYLHLADRRLSMLVGFRWVDGSGFGDAIGMEHLYHAMLGAMITVASTCANVARAGGVAEPSDALAWEGWLQPDNDLKVADVVSFGGLRPENGGDQHTGHFPAARAAGTDIEDLDALARDWLTYWLLDMGSLGPRDFEQWIAGWPRPDFLRMPSLV
jgi:Putative DNA-binding domain